MGHWYAMVALALLPSLSALATAADKASDPSAVVADSASLGDGHLGPLPGNGGIFFVLRAIDGQSTDRDALRASLQASRGRGTVMVLREVERPVPAGMRKLTVRAEHAYAAPIQTMFAKATSYEMQGEIEVELRPDVRYRIKGNLDAFRREIWIEEDGTGVVVGKKLGDTGSPLAITEDAPGMTYACCNLRYEGDWISDGSITLLPFVPAGARVRVLKHGSNRVEVDIEGRSMRLGLDYGRKNESTEQMVQRLVRRENPRRQIATFPPEVQAAIVAGRVMPEMTREQVLMSLGYPPPDANRSIADNEWTYRTVNDDEFVLVWSPGGGLSSVRATPAVLSRVVHVP